MLKEIPADFRFTLTDPAGKDAYPISGTTWAVVRLEQLQSPDRELLDFLTWISKDGQAFVPELNYGPIPPALGERIHQKLKDANSQIVK
jgi:phosphate transport system substrate-binding protein